MTEAATATPGRSADCKAVDVDGLTICHRCGLQWEITDPAPPKCDPMTFARMRRRLAADISSAEISLSIVESMKNKGSPADPASARSRLAELNAVLRLFDRATETKELRDLILGKKKP